VLFSMRKLSLPPLIIWPAAVFLAAFLVYPLLLTVAISFYDFTALGGMKPAFKWDNYQILVTDPYYVEVLLGTLQISIIVTICCLVIGYPLALWMTRLDGAWKAVAMFCALAPLMISVVIRSLGWIVILSDTGLINQLLMASGITDQPVRLLYTEFAVIVGLTEALLPFMIISLLVSLQAIPRSLLQAASITGAGHWTVFSRILLPLSLPGIAAGSLLVFAIATSSFVTPRILSGGHVNMVANLVVDNFLVTLNWPFGAAVGILLLLVVLMVFLVQHWLTERILGQYR